MKILNEIQIKQKTRRLAYQIYENNFEAPEIIIAGINNAGMRFAQLLLDELLQITDTGITITRISINPAKPLQNEIKIGIPLEKITGNVVIIVDDVANTGRTLYYAFKPIMETLPQKVEIAVLVDREHKLFPVKVDYVGLSLHTTLLENIEVKIAEDEEFAAFLN